MKFSLQVLHAGQWSLCGCSVEARYSFGCGVLKLPGRPNQVLGPYDSFVDFDMEFTVDLLYVDHVCVVRDRQFEMGNTSSRYSA